jgi:hypothetical protein
VNAACASPAALAPAVAAMVTTNTPIVAAIQAQSQGLRKQHHRRALRRFQRIQPSRSASTRIRIAPCAPICQSGDSRRNDRNDPASVSVSAPTTAPTADTRPP